MNDLAKRWIEALRSGEYKQSVGGLRNKNGFCCLGVLCDVRGGGEWEGTEHYILDGIAQSGFPPSVVREDVGLSYQQQKVLALMNDNGKPFEEIADEAERMLS